jgi:hypothetical protein
VSVISFAYGQCVGKVYITLKFIASAGGPRSPFVRSAMAQAGDKLRVSALIDFLVSVGSCEITFDDAKTYGLEVRRKKFSFMGSPLVFAFLDPMLFTHFRQIMDRVDLQVAGNRNGIIGIRRNPEE